MSIDSTAAPQRAGAASRRYALLVVVDAESPKQAFQAVARAVLQGGEPRGVYVGVPHQGLPLAAEEFATERIAVQFSQPDGEDQVLWVSAELRPSD